MRILKENVYLQKAQEKDKIETYHINMSVAIKDSAPHILLKGVISFQNSIDVIHETESDKRSWIPYHNTYVILSWGATDLD